MATLNITLDQVINYALSQGVSEVTYYCPANNYSCYYQFDDQSIHINLSSMEHTYETLGTKNDIWLNDLDECQVYSILHELGHHLQPQYFRLKDQRYQAEVDAWDRAEHLLKSLNKEVPDNFYVYRDFKLDTYSDYKHDAHSASNFCSVLIEKRINTEQKLEKIEKEIKQCNTIIASLLLASLLIGGLIVYNTIDGRPINSSKCNDYDCIF